jgi:hypothetical protein
MLFRWAASATRWMAASSTFPVCAPSLTVTSTIPGDLGSFPWFSSAWLGGGVKAVRPAWNELRFWIGLRLGGCVSVVVIGVVLVVL